jgi:hypothetical protein
MSRLSKTVKIFAAAGIAFNGVLTVDAMALARALDTGSPVAVENFIVQHSQSDYVGDALMYLAKNDKGGKDKGSKGNKGGNKGSNKGGNKGGSSGGSSGGGDAGSSRDGSEAKSGGNGSRFKPAGDQGRPDLFGPPGTPVIGPPGQYDG